MSHSVKLAVALVALMATAPTVSFAGSIEDQVSEEQLAEFCGQVGLGETNAALTLLDGTVLQGTIDCDEDDLVVGDVRDETEDDDQDADDADDAEDDDDSADADDDSEDGDDGEGSDDDGDDRES